jgi:flagellar hook-associated protein 2
MATNIVSTLGAGSGIDVKSLAQSLVDAEKTPRKDAIDAKIKQSEAKISGHGAVKYALSQLQTAFSKMNDASEFASIKTTNSQPAAFGVSTTSLAEASSFNVSVGQIAQAQRTVTGGFAARNTALSADADLELTLVTGISPDTTSDTISVSNKTPAGIVSAINSANKGISAQLVNTGSNFKIVITGGTGAAKAFALTSSSTDVTFNAPAQAAQDAQFSINGLSITRNSNTISDVVDGVTFDLYTPTTTPARLELQRETTSIKDNIKELVTAYNDFESAMKVLGDRESKVAEFGGALAGDNLLQTVRSQVRTMVTGNFKAYANPSATTGTPLNPDVYAGRHVGLSIDRNGVLTLDEAKLDKALSSHFDQVSTMFTAGQNAQSVYNPANGGLAGEAVKKLDKMLRSTGIIDGQTKSATAKITAYKADLTKLDEQMTKLLDRYTQQFSVMDSIVGNSNNVRSGLKNTFASMSSSNNN